jgi:putative spermidine/putrescine transport system ATP-binding protein
MDEPLGALDKKLRDQMQLEIKRIHRELGTTIVYVTHDQEEAMTMSDRICLMNHGRIEQLGTPSDLYFRPRTLFVADFLGESNLIEGTVERVEGSEAEVRLAQDGGRARATVHAPLSAGSKVRVMVRPQNIAVRAEAGEVNAVRGKVLDSMITGSLTKLYVESAVRSEPFVLCYPTSAADAPHAIGDDINLHWNHGDAVAVPESV